MWAVAARFLCGILNGNLGVAKTYLSEVSLFHVCHHVPYLLCAVLHSTCTVLLCARYTVLVCYRFVMTLIKQKDFQLLHCQQVLVDLWYVTVSIALTLLPTVHFQGPAVGGFFAQPAGKYSLFETPFFCQFPFLLPCLFGFATGVISLTCT